MHLIILSSQEYSDGLNMEIDEPELFCDPMTTNLKGELPKQSLPSHP